VVVGWGGGGRAGYLSAMLSIYAMLSTLSIPVYLISIDLTIYLCIQIAILID